MDIAEVIAWQALAGKTTKTADGEVDLQNLQDVKSINFHSGARIIDSGHGNILDFVSADKQPVVLSGITDDDHTNSAITATRVNSILNSTMSILTLFTSEQLHKDSNAINLVTLFNSLGNNFSTQYQQIITNYLSIGRNYFYLLSSNGNLFFVSNVDLSKSQYNLTFLMNTAGKDI